MLTFRCATLKLLRILFPFMLIPLFVACKEPTRAQSNGESAEDVVTFLMFGYDHDTALASSKFQKLQLKITPQSGCVYHVQFYQSVEKATLDFTIDFSRATDMTPQQISRDGYAALINGAVASGKITKETGVKNFDHIPAWTNWNREVPHYMNTPERLVRAFQYFQNTFCKPPPY